ncbi:MAG: hypothetical protein ACP5MC_01435 [Candidatus Micrarchaeia archaeon]
MRGREELVICDNCGRKVPRNKAVAYTKVVAFSTDMHTGNDVKFFERKKVYYCISCAKHLGIFEKKKAQARRRASLGV